MKLQEVAERQNGQNQRRYTLMFAFIMALFAFASCRYYIAHIPFGQPPDEAAHASYILDVAVRGHLIPDYKNSLILSTSDKNYLTHPPLYYTIMGVIGRITHHDPANNYHFFRTINAAMVALGIFLWILTAARWNFSKIGMVALVAGTLAIPMFPYLAGSINNDNLAYLGAALFFYGLSGLHDRSRGAYYVCAVALIIAFLTKGTVALFMASFIVAWMWLSRGEAKQLYLHKHFYYAAILVVIACSAYYIPTFLTYGTPFPAPTKIYPHNPPAHPIGVLNYFFVFVEIMTSRLPVAMTGLKLFSPIPRGMIWAFYVMLCVPLAAWAVWRPFLPPSRLRNLFDAFVIALLVNIAANFVVAYRGYLNTGLTGGIQPRYYNYALPGIFLFPLLLVDKKWIRPTAILIFGAVAALLVGIEPPRVAAEHIAYAATLSKDSITVSAQANDSLRVGYSTGNAGYLDSATSNGGLWTLSGWAIDAQTKLPAESVMVVYKQQLVGSTQPGFTRVDVAQAVNSQQALESGYSVLVAGLPDNVNPCDFQVLAAQSAGGFVVLKNSACGH